MLLLLFYKGSFSGCQGQPLASPWHLLISSLKLTALPSLSVRLRTRYCHTYSLPYCPLPSTLLITHAQLACSLPYTQAIALYLNQSYTHTGGSRQQAKGQLPLSNFTILHFYLGRPHTLQEQVHQQTPGRSHPHIRVYQNTDRVLYLTQDNRVYCRAATPADVQQIVSVYYGWIDTDQEKKGILNPFPLTQADQFAAISRYTSRYLGSRPLITVNGIRIGEGRPDRTRSPPKEIGNALQANRGLLTIEVPPTELRRLNVLKEMQRASA